MTRSLLTRLRFDSQPNNQRRIRFLVGRYVNKMSTIYPKVHFDSFAPDQKVPMYDLKMSFLRSTSVVRSRTHERDYFGGIISFSHEKRDLFFFSK